MLKREDGRHIDTDDNGTLQCRRLEVLLSTIISSGRGRCKRLMNSPLAMLGSRSKITNARQR